MTDDENANIVEIGGQANAFSVSLNIYGDDLIPDEITALLGRPPTDSHLRGDKKGPNSADFEQGAWLLTLRGEPEEPPDVLTRKLLAVVPIDHEVWDKLKKKFEIHISYGITVRGWNKGFDMPADLIARIALLNAQMGFDIYVDDEEENETV